MNKITIPFIFFYLLFHFSSGQSIDYEYSVNSDSTYEDKISVNSRYDFAINDAYLNFSGEISASEKGSEFWFYLNNSTLFFSNKAKIDNNLSGLVYAKTFRYQGQNCNEDTIIFDEGFKADNTGYDTTYSPDNQPNWSADGFSSMRVKNVSLIHKHSQSHPSIHKKTTGGEHTHHGLIGFSGICKWIIKENDQFNDCQITWDTTFTLITKKDLVFKGLAINGVQAFFGPKGTENDTIIKKGKGTLTMNGAQVYNSGTVMNIKEGDVVFKWNPAIKNEFNKSIGLNLNVNKNTACSFDNIKAEIEHLTSEGKVKIDSGRLVIVNGISLKEQSQLELINDSAGYTIQAGGDIELNGALKLENTKKGDTVKIAHSGTSINGTFNSVTEGFKVVYKSNKVFAVKQKNIKGIHSGNKSYNSIQFINYPENPFIVTKRRLGEITIDLINMTGRKFATNQLFAGKNNKIYLKKLFDHIPQNQLFIIKIQTSYDQWIFKSLVKY